MSDEHMKRESAKPESGEAQNCAPGASGPGASGPMSWSCRPSLEDVYRYLDGAMEQRQQDYVASHLSVCDGCEDFLHFHNGLRRLVGDRCRTELPMDLPDRVFRAIDELG